LKITLNHKTTFPIPRFGITIKLPKSLAEVNYLGRGPHENYPDRKESAHWGPYYATPEKMKPSYISPQESAYRSANEELIITDSKGKGYKFTSDKDFGFSYLPYSQDAIMQKSRGSKNTCDLKEDDFFTLCLDSHMMGVGGIDSWLSEPLNQYLLRQGEYQFILYITAV